MTDTDWHDLVKEYGRSSRVVKIQHFQQNNDDGWVHVTLPFYFHWFGEIENVITIGTNGLLTFGTGHLAYGGSEPVPCAHGQSCDHGHRVKMDGVIAPFWCDLNPDKARNGDGVYYKITNQSSLVVQWSVDTFGGSEQHCFVTHSDIVAMA